MSWFYSGKAFDMAKNFSAAQDALAWVAALIMLLGLAYMIRRMF